MAKVKIKKGSKKKIVAKLSVKEAGLIASVLGECVPDDKGISEELYDTFSSVVRDDKYELKIKFGESYPRIVKR